MNDTIRYSNSCKIREVESNKELDCEVLEFKPKDRLVVIINKAVKVPLRWNGNLYEGKMAGLELVSYGPLFKNVKTSIRG